MQVALVDGAFYAVDSPDQALHTAGASTDLEAPSKFDPILPEPTMRVEVTVPRCFTSNAQRRVTGRRGQLLADDAREDLEGWDAVRSLVPQAELADIIIELRSQTLGLGGYTADFDHHQELVGRAANQVNAQAKDGRRAE